MIDCENEVYTRIVNAVREKYPQINVSGEYVRCPTSFPHFSFEQEDSYSDTTRQDTDISREYDVILFTVNVYSNLKSGKKAECKSIMKIIDSEMRSMNCTRLVCSPVPNMEDASIYRIVARYRVEADETHFYRR